MAKKNLEFALCQNCGQDIALATYAELGGWEPDYDPADDPRTWRHKNGYAVCPTSFAKPTHKDS